MLRVYYWDVVIFCRLGLHSAPNLGWSGIQKKKQAQCAVRGPTDFTAGTTSYQKELSYHLTS